MCGGVEFTFNDEIIRSYFPNPKARLPVKNKSGNIVLIPWGRRKEQTGCFPLGGWARLESIKKGVWKKYHPTPVKIAVDRFMEKDKNGTSHWFDIDSSTFIQGLVVQKKSETRVYVVTISPEDKDAIHNRWPRILNE